MRKYLVTIALAVLCIVCGSMGISTAYLTKSEKRTNEFTFVGDRTLDCELTEPSWDSEKAIKVLPDMTIPKDPQVTNTSKNDLDEAVALQLEFVYGTDCQDKEKVGRPLSDADMKIVSEVFKVDWNADKQKDWIRYTDENGAMQVQHFYYASLLRRNKERKEEKGETTQPLFTTITIDKNVNNEKYSKIQDMGGIEIRISGCAVQQIEDSGQKDRNLPKEVYEAGLFSFPA